MAFLQLYALLIFNVLSTQSILNVLYIWNGLAG